MTIVHIASVTTLVVFALYRGGVEVDDALPDLELPHGVFRIERVISRKAVRGRSAWTKFDTEFVSCFDYLVKWAGIHDSHNSYCRATRSYGQSLVYTYEKNMCPDGTLPPGGCPLENVPLSSLVATDPLTKEEEEEMDQQFGATNDKRCNTLKKHQYK